MAKWGGRARGPRGGGGGAGPARRRPILPYFAQLFNPKITFHLQLLNCHITRSTHLLFRLWQHSRDTCQTGFDFIHGIGQENIQDAGHCHCHYTVSYGNKNSGLPCAGPCVNQCPTLGPCVNLVSRPCVKQLGQVSWTSHLE